MLSYNIYPWQQTSRQQFFAYWQAGRLPHALLLSGMKGLGKKQFAQHIAQFVLCEKPLNNGQCCGQCYSCQLEDITHHPDYFILNPEADSQLIKIEAVRDLIVQLHSTSHYKGYRVISIFPAENMNSAAANALLKTLEEPKGKTLFLLISDAAARLTATIRSRCQYIYFQPDFSRATQNWLQQQTACDLTQADLMLKRAEGAPLVALQFINDKEALTLEKTMINDLLSLSAQQISALSLAPCWQEKGGLMCIDSLLSILNQLLRILVNKAEKSSDTQLDALLFHAQRISLLEWMDYTREIMLIRARLIQSPNLNPQLLIESLLIRWPVRL